MRDPGKLRVHAQLGAHTSMTFARALLHLHAGAALTELLEVGRRAHVRMLL